MASTKLPEEKAIYSVTEASHLSGMTSPRIMRRIRNKTIEAWKIGWVWVLPRVEVEKLKQEMEKEKDNKESD
jgi:hypothetical protein